MNKLLIVESPAKAKTIQKYLGDGYKVVSSKGHVRDLPESEFGVDISKKFKPKFVLIKGKKNVVNEIKKLSEGREVLLAPDNDREGESIAWHLAELLKLDTSKPIRIVFNEITEKVIKEAVKNPKQLDFRKVDAQLTRRILDRIVGYGLSPLLWRLMKRGLSAGRVQSVALKLVCEREKEIFTFQPVHYHKIFVIVNGVKVPLVKIKGRKIKPEDTSDEKKYRSIIDEIKSSVLKVVSIEKKQTKRQPPQPYITSTLQQDANNLLGWSASKTMKVAQQLYEGVETPEGNMAFITYMRTDSTRVSETAKDAAKAYIESHFGTQYAGSGSKKRSSRGKVNVQDAHEAIRPTYIEIDPESAKHLLKGDHLRLYTMVWKRFMASQMAPSVYEETSFGLETPDGRYRFEISSKKRIFDGFEKVFGSSQEKMLDLSLKEGEEIKDFELVSEDAETTPPPRYTEASLVRTLETNGIGRPSTYATIISTLMEREYVVRRGKELVPTLVGFLVVDFLERYFPKIMDVGFTAKMEEELDEIEEGRKNRLEVLEEFYREFGPSLEGIEEKLGAREIQSVYESNAKCEACGGDMKVHVGRFGPYLRCERCEKTENLDPVGTVLIDGVVMVKKKIEEKTGDKCPKCGSDLIVKRGKYGEFVACSAYPECDYTRNVRARGTCPKCGGPVEKRRSKKGRYYWSCTECEWMGWNEPSPHLCPSCGGRLFFRSQKGQERLYCEEERLWFDISKVSEL
ncbi:MAG: topoisomerase [Thermotogota bacterium]|nr:topoisomerase [Thermotogota bacterium]MDK2863836.1 topoisomerase [Thermotogota bacterium]HCZ05978.1 type I DNA topoisomerase [Thermotogota bacterium]